MDNHYKTYFFCGIGGSGMSALARILRAQGHAIKGSDRSRDRGVTDSKFEALASDGIILCPQDGSGIDASLDALVVSSAVEERIADVRAARSLGIPVKARAEILADLVNTGKGICIAGTSGKTTVTGMTGHILKVCEKDPTIINGGVMSDYGTNAVAGTGNIFVTETDESDGSVTLFSPDIAVLHNISFDHKPLDELKYIFSTFLSGVKDRIIVNGDDDHIRELVLKDVSVPVYRYGTGNDNLDLRADDIALFPEGTACTITDRRGGQSAKLRLKVPGAYNVMNGLAALSVALHLKIPLRQACEALSSFSGIERRMNIVGTVGNITVYDDFAHNPDKILASLSFLKSFPGRLHVIFQPHGFRPTAMLRDDFVKAFVSKLDNRDFVYMPEIYFAGGTAEKVISSQDIVNDLSANALNAVFTENRTAIPLLISQQAREGDKVILMGARDDTLSAFAQEILQSLSSSRISSCI